MASHWHILTKFCRKKSPLSIVKSVVMYGSQQFKEKQNRFHKRQGLQINTYIILITNNSMYRLSYFKIKQRITEWEECGHFSPECARPLLLANSVHFSHTKKVLCCLKLQMVFVIIFIYFYNHVVQTVL